jgi:phage shock protein A
MPTMKELAESRAQTIDALNAQNAELREQLAATRNKIADAEQTAERCRRALLETVRAAETMRGYIQAVSEPDADGKMPFDDLGCMYQVDQVLV